MVTEMGGALLPLGSAVEKVVLQIGTVVLPPFLP